MHAGNISSAKLLSLHVLPSLSPTPHPPGSPLKELPLMALFIKTDLDWQQVNKIQVLVREVLYYGLLLGGVERI